MSPAPADCWCGREDELTRGSVLRKVGEITRSDMPN